MKTFDENNFHTICNLLAQQDKILEEIISRHGYPPFWSRPNTFPSLVHIILEQQVSLQSGLAAMNKLNDRLPDLTSSQFLTLSDDALKACYFSRQKISYVRHLAQQLELGKLDLLALELLSDEQIRALLTQVKGIGNWTVDIYLLMVLHRCDIFPSGDLAAVNGLKKLVDKSSPIGKEELLDIAARWQPYRSVATMLIWHNYLEDKKNLKR